MDHGQVKQNACILNNHWAEINITASMRQLRTL